MRLFQFLFLVAFLHVAQAKQVSVHDPVMAKEGETYYLFSTGPGITFYSSQDMKNWKLAGRVFPGEPVWAKNIAKSFNGHIWAPDIVLHNGVYFLYYSISAFGKNTSAIGVTTNTTLNPDAPQYKWVDQGIVLESVPNRDLWNAIDPGVIVDEKGTPWMSFGSFWGGLKIVKLDPGMTKVAEPQEWYTIAKRLRQPFTDDRQGGSAEIEAPFIFKKGNFYYQFLSWDKCCRGKESTYKIMVGRSTDVRGPYVDKEGKGLNEGGGSLVLAGTEKWPGLGHNSAYTFGDKDFLVFHAYETADDGLQKLKIAEIFWDQNEWPSVNPNALEEYQSLQTK